MKIEEYLDVAMLQRFLDHLYESTGVGAGIISADGTILTMTEWRRICLNFHRANPITEQFCIKSDTTITEKLASGEGYAMYQCANGLYDVGVPIIIGDKHMMTIFQGQFFLEPPDRDFFIAQAEKYGFDKEDYLSAVDEVPIVDRGLLTDRVRLLCDLADFIKSIADARISLESAYDELTESHKELQVRNKQIFEAKESLAAQYEVLLGRTQELESFRRRYSLILQGTKDVIWDEDYLNDKVFYDESVKALLETEKSIEVVDDFLSHIHPDDMGHAREVFMDVLEEGDHYTDEYRIITEKNNEKWVHVTARTERNEKGELVRMAGSISDISARKAYEVQIEEMAYRDKLTGLFNRNRMLADLEEQVRQCEVGGADGLGIIYTDLDNFKHINDAYGHKRGDHVLARVAERLRISLPKELELYRSGGDEFVFVAKVKEGSKLKAYGKAVKEALREPVLYKGKEYRITASMGMSIYGEGGEDVTSMLMNADLALYEAKEQGPGHYVVYEASMGDEAFRKRNTEEALVKAIEKDELFLVYQPKICSKTKSVQGLETLVRWRQSDGRIIPPMTFIPIAEERGLIKRLDMWVITRTFEQVAKWRSNNIDPGVVSINVTPETLTDGEFIVFLDELFHRTGLPAQSIQFEITESIFLEHSDRSADVFRNLRDIRCRSSLG